MLIALASLMAAMVAVPVALGHVERASYWPNPAGEKVGKKGTGGGVPKARGLFTALDKAKPGKTRVVCQENSMQRLKKSLKKGMKKGWRLRPSQPRKDVEPEEAAELIEINQKLTRKCRYDSIQEAILRSGNNDRVVVMPGIYTEPESREAPTNDPRCEQFEIDNDEGNPRALSYAYQVNCPNDQNLIYIPGRALGPGEDPQPSLFERRGIPNIGPCVRCNLQLEGSGLRPDDVVIDAGRVESGNSGPLGSVKDVAVFADRADGFVLRNMSIRHPLEHAIYVLEVDGYRLERFRTPYNGEYGVLTFVSDHGLIQKCDAYGSGDAAIYPGASPDTKEQVRAPDTPRYNTEIRYCDMHHSALGFSGTDANAVHVHHNDFYDNANGYSTDVFTASGHPGFPQDSNLVENNKFYSNNFNPYVAGSDVDPTVPVPVGTGMWIAGGNGNIVRNNHFWNNWRRGAMLFSVPDEFACDDPDDQVPDCNPGSYATSYRNQFYGNVMGRTPKTKKKNAVRDPNGEDFWWDEGGLNPPNPNTQNCWFNNTGRDGTATGLRNVPTTLPADCANSFARGNGEARQAGELLRCLNDLSPSNPDCPWFTTPPEPQ